MGPLPRALAIRGIDALSAPGPLLWLHFPIRYPRHVKETILGFVFLAQTRDLV